MEETGAAQHYRDARIAPIYEGTNGIQAIDLAGRKLGLAGGAAVRALFADVRATAGELAGSAEGRLHGPAERLRTAVDAAERATDWLAVHKGSPDALAGASGHLTLMGDVIGGWELAKAALAAGRRPDAAYGTTKAALLRVYADQVLSKADGLAAGVIAGAEDLAEVRAETLAA
mgnify:CR=1 FL=1